MLTKYLCRGFQECNSRNVCPHSKLHSRIEGSVKDIMNCWLARGQTKCHCIRMTKSKFMLAQY
jgi:hypothetical protein